MDCRYTKTICHPNLKVSHEEMNTSTTLHTNTFASELDHSVELDRCQDFENNNVVHRLIRLVENLQQKLDSKDKQIASKDELIQSLEDKIVTMSLDLASNKTRVDELQHGLKQSFTTRVCSRKGNDSTTDAPTSTTLNRVTVTRRPVSTHRHRHEKNCSCSGSLAGPSSIGRAKEDLVLGESAKTSFSRDTSTSTLTNSFVTRSTNHSNSGRQGFDLDLDDSNTLALDEPNKSRLANFRQLFLKNISKECRKGQSKNDVGDAYPSSSPDNCKNNHLPRDLSSLAGVVFPVSSFDVLKKGCRASSSFALLKKGCLAKKNEGSKGGSNEEWPEFE
mmetsp:Transcript_15064/g.31981  ORF Transcript_15064/g.31981 Transcript_15064/m.31981 type:complete len:333 (-) Transcript_15064:131-1129(-)